MRRVTRGVTWTRSRYRGFSTAYASRGSEITFSKYRIKPSRVSKNIRFPPRLHLSYFRSTHLSPHGLKSPSTCRYVHHPPLVERDSWRTTMDDDKLDPTTQQISTQQNHIPRSRKIVLKFYWDATSNPRGNLNSVHVSIMSLSFLNFFFFSSGQTWPNALLLGWVVRHSRNLYNPIRQYDQKKLSFLLKNKFKCKT